MKLSILMPVYNEEARLPEAMKQAQAEGILDLQKAGIKIDT